MLLLYRENKEIIMLNKIKNWLLYDKPLFSKEVKEWILVFGRKTGKRIG